MRLLIIGSLSSLLSSETLHSKLDTEVLYLIADQLLDTQWELGRPYGGPYLFRYTVEIG